MRRAVILSDRIRARGLMIWGSPGAGKSVLMGRVIAWQDFFNYHPVVVIDPIGTVTDYFLSKAGVHERVIYADMNGIYVVSFPLYAQSGSLYDIAQKFPETVRLSDPAILAAPVHGYNPFLEIATHTGMVLAALNLSIIHAKSLLRNPDAWAEKFTEAAAKHADCAPACDFFMKEYSKWPQERKHSATMMFRMKTMPFYNDQSLRAICCSTIPGIEWASVVKKQQIVLLDFRHITNEQIKSFLSLWVLKDFDRFVRTRNYDSPPITLIIDELKTLFSDPHSEDGDSAFSKELVELTDVIARNYRIWPVFATQDPLSFGEKSRQSLLGMGTHIIGPVNNTAAAELLAKSLFSQDPLKIKDSSAIRNNIYYSLAEQIELTCQRISALKPLHFLMRPAISEGGISKKVYPISIEHLDRGLWPDQDKLTQIRDELAKRSGRPIQEVLDEIAQQAAPVIPPQEEEKPKQKRGSIRNGKNRNSLPPQDTNEDVS